ncbi:MAG TPA: TetR/AcrR family transcriptional regulator [Hyphomicrobiaceae bacterium]|jgi:TetR/AcrR family transcriptional repressor of mexJK operon|nr:TetR/AcrR family transcriptional regulator [Hyphomicrobiaceae bacterium]
MAAKRKTKEMQRGPGRLSAAETAQLEDRLLDAAERVFVAQGYARATMDAIAKEAGASRKTFYARYANKADVLTAVVNRLLDSAITPHKKGVRSPAVGRDPAALLLQIARELAGLSETPHVAGINRLVFAEALQAPDLARLFLDLHARAADDVRANLEELRDEGSLPRLPNSKLAAVIFIEMAASMPRLRALLGAPLSRKETNDLTAAAVQIFLHGCGRA